MQQFWNSPRFRIAVLAAIAVALIGLAVTRPTDPLGAPSEPDLILVELTTTTVATTSTTSTIYSNHSTCRDINNTLTYTCKYTVET